MDSLKRSYFEDELSVGTLPKNLAMEGTIAIVPASRSGSVNLVITQAIANVPTDMKISI